MNEKILIALSVVGSNYINVVKVTAELSFQVF